MIVVVPAKLWIFAILIGVNKRERNAKTYCRRVAPLPHPFRKTSKLSHINIIECRMIVCCLKGEVGEMRNCPIISRGILIRHTGSALTKAVRNSSPAISQITFSRSSSALFAIFLTFLSVGNLIEFGKSLISSSAIRWNSLSIQ